MTTMQPLWETIGRMFKSEAVRREILSLPDAERESLFRRLGISEQELGKLISGHLGPENQLPSRLRISGLDVEELSSKHSALMRDMERVCSLCERQRRCARDLTSGADDRIQSYCPNTSTIDALTAER